MGHVGPRRGAPKRIEQHRWLRSDGTPNFSDRIYRKTEDMELLAKRPVASVASSTPVMEALEEMNKGYRSLLVVKAGGYLEGIVVAMDFVNYLGGGELYNIIINRHNYNIYSALNNESVGTLMNKNPIVAYIDESLPHVLERMVLNNVGVIPVVTRDNKVYGIITEKDILDFLSAGPSMGIKVSEIMSSPVITTSSSSSLRDAMKTMVKFGFRRLPVIRDNIVEGIVTAMDIIRFFGSHRVFNYTTTGNIEEATNIPIEEVMVKEVVTINPSADVGDAAKLMAERNVGSILVVNEYYELLGIVSERDILYAIATSRR